MSPLVLESLLIEVDQLSAQQCYQATPGIFDCTHFIRNNLPTSVDKQASCPFDPSMCRSNTSNIRLDTGILDTAKDLGINAPDGESIQFRSVLHCAPLETRGYSENRNTPSGNFTVYSYGASVLSGSKSGNETYMTESVEFQYQIEDDEPHVAYGQNLVLVSVHISVIEPLPISPALSRNQKNRRPKERSAPQPDHM